MQQMQIQVLDGIQIISRRNFPWKGSCTLTMDPRSQRSACPYLRKALKQVHLFYGLYLVGAGMKIDND